MSDWPTKYIGDGVDASFDGFQVWLRTTRGFAVHEIALEPRTFNAMVGYIASLGPEVLRHFGIAGSPKEEL